MLASVYAPSVLHAMGVAMMIPALPLFAGDLGLSVGEIGAVLTAQGIAAVACNVPAGLLAGRVGARVAMALGLCIAVVSAVGLSATSGAPLLLAAVLGLGAGGALYETTRLGYVADAAGSEERAIALASVGGAGRIGFMLGPFAGAAITGAWGLRGAFVGQAALSIAALGCIALGHMARRAPVQRAPEPALHQVASVVRDHWRPLASTGSIAFALVAVRTARRVLVPLWGAYVGLGIDQIYYAVAASGALETLMFYPAGLGMDRFGRRATIVPCFCIVAASLALLPQTTTLWAFVLVECLGGLGNGLGSGAVMTLGADLAPPGKRPLFLGVWRMIADSGGMLAPVLVGVIATAFSLGGALYAAAGLSALGGVAMLVRRSGAIGSTGEVRGGAATPEATVAAADALRTPAASAAGGPTLDPARTRGRTPS
jgi:MFS family permease